MIKAGLRAGMQGAHRLAGQGVRAVAASGIAVRLGIALGAVAALAIAANVFVEQGTLERVRAVA